jgi:L-serine dehydratase
MIATYELNHFPVKWQGDTHALLVTNPETVSSTWDNFRSNHKDIIVESSSYNSIAVHGTGNGALGAEKGETALFVEFSAPATDDELRKYFPAGHYRYFPALLPVLSFRGRKPQLFKTAGEWIAYAEKHTISFVDAAIEYEKAFSGWDEKQIWDYFEHIRDILNYQIHALEELGYENVPDTKLLPVYGKNWNRYKKEKTVLQDPLVSRIMDYAFSVNAKIPGVKIVPGPMGTGGGYLFSALEAVREARGYSRQKQLEGLVVAAGLGAIAYTLCRASGLSGCAGESGICCAMASGAITWMAGGTGKQAENAASMALQANIGIPCDPIPGGLEFPCLTRTVRAAITAPLYADMALCGIDPLVPYHEVLLAIERNREKNPEAVCGPDCGLNRTATAGQCRRFLSQDVMAGKLRFEA